MRKKLLAHYQNGNYLVYLYSDGTKIKRFNAEKAVAKFPDSIDLKITNYCDKNCPMCHENSNVNGKHANLNAPILQTLKRGTELAIGGGNPLSHPQLEIFLKDMKNRGVVCNLTVNGDHLKGDKKRVERLIESGLIYGLGISIIDYDEEAVEFAKKYQNCVLHLISGIFSNYEKLFDKNLKILILGYKTVGKGKDYFSEKIQKNINATARSLSNYLNKFQVISFDNLALSQLNVKMLLTEEEYQTMFMGNDGESSMYIDLVKGEMAISSASSKRIALQNDIITAFESIKNTN